MERLSSPRSPPTKWLGKGERFEQFMSPTWYHIWFRIFVAGKVVGDLDEERKRSKNVIRKLKLSGPISIPDDREWRRSIDHGIGMNTELGGSVFINKNGLPDPTPYLPDMNIGTVYISGRDLISIPNYIRLFDSATELELSGPNMIIDDKIYLIKSLKKLTISNNLTFQTLPDGIERLSKLSYLKIECCPEFKKVPESLLRSNVKEIHLRFRLKTVMKYIENTDPTVLALREKGVVVKFESYK